MAKLYFSHDTDESRSLSKKVKNGELIRIYRGIYTDVSYAEVEKLVNAKWYEIVNYLFPNAVAAYRTAHELRPYQGCVYIVKNDMSRRKVIVAKTLTIDIDSGSTTDLVEPFIATLGRSSPARKYLENLVPSRVKKSKSLGKEWVERSLAGLMRQENAEQVLNVIRDEAFLYAKKHDLENEYQILNSIVSALLSTHSDSGYLDSEIAIASAQKVPYDEHRIDLFRSFANYLLRCNLEAASYTYSKHSWKNLAFFESYFSNFIEGTEFEIDEAQDIVFTGKPDQNRHKDSHDVLGVFAQVSDIQDMSITPSSADELIETIKRVHFDFMRERKDKRAGQFKLKTNKAGSSVFVHPHELVGTLYKAFDIYTILPQGLERAIFMQFMLSECHPFDDGNGRLSRIMMNRELHCVDLHKIIVPTVHRDSYLNGLRLATRQGRFATIVKVFYQLQHYTASINWQDLDDARNTIERHHANLLPDDGVPAFNKIIRQFTFEPPREY